MSDSLEQALQNHRESLDALEQVIQQTPTQEPLEGKPPVSGFVEISYFVAIILFVIGLKNMSSPVTARRGIHLAGIGMVLAMVATLFYPDLHNFLLIFLAIGLGSGVAWWTAQRVAMTDMPQMIAVYNGLGGGAAAAIAAVELIKHQELPLTVQILAVLGALIGSVAFSGSVIAYAKLDGLMKKSVHFPQQQMINLAVFVLTLILGVTVIVQGNDASTAVILLFFVFALAFGVMLALPIGGADMPVVISLFNALTGLAVGFEGYVLGNAAMIIAGIVVGAAGTLLTQLMAKAMNRPLTNVLFQSFGQQERSGEGQAVEGTMKSVEASDAAIMMAYANQVIIVPGYGMAVAQAQHKIWEFAKLLIDRGVKVKFAIHPVAGRMPGHMNVLLAEAGVPYDIIFDMDEINAEFPQTDVALVIGANDVVNPAAQKLTDSPIYGMPILEAEQAQNVIVIKRGQGRGFSGVENLLFFNDNTQMLYGDGQKVGAALVGQLKEL